jgi:hypothetical protein
MNKIFFLFFIIFLVFCGGQESAVNMEEELLPDSTATDSTSTSPASTVEQSREDANISAPTGIISEARNAADAASDRTLRQEAMIDSLLGE